MLSTITLDDVWGKLKVWQESMSTSPSRQYLGRYKVLVAFLGYSTVAHLELMADVCI